ncbi:hypothetical protein ACJ72_06947 [Emergomyces africanus]|uniref:Uncharacterized protein n=1 Tax=Emergomyces africanus TaxID=1955775 RepID=A0A1B7NPK1_9EURO|nr:hypothetical protein ACJ72_06947 [Emergomyces africanus]
MKQGESQDKDKMPAKEEKTSSPKAPANDQPPKKTPLNESSLRLHLEQMPEKYDPMQRYLDQVWKEDTFSVFTIASRAKAARNLRCKKSNSVVKPLE